MAKQLPLQGFEQLRSNEVDELALARRKSDNRVQPSRRLDAVIRQFPTLKNEGYTWPVIIYTLGRFSVLHKGKPLEYGRKVPQRPLLFLKTLIALGGREVSVSSLTAILWPDADGDTAKRSFDTTLYRLRKLFENEPVLLLSDGKVSLDSSCCWIDVWAFERLLGQVQRIRTRDATGKDAYQLDQLTDRMLGLYQNHFLAREDMTPWSVSLRERLRSKFIYNLLDVGRYWEIHGFWDRAIQCYQKGLEVDDLIEVFYQRLMLCCLETHRISEGMSVYRRCRQILSVVLGLQPEPETDAIYRSLKNARLQKLPA
ncbi:MAG: BTAD domain-containing putative transcriptional regulator [Thiohalobacterales bacterium]